MAVTLTSADSALKSVYLDVISEQLDSRINPFYAAIQKSTNDVWGKEVRKLAVYGINGGIGAGTEDGNLPEARGNNYAQFVSTLKNLYGVIEISDKAVRASANNSGAFVNLLNAEMEGLIKSSTFNFGRMLFGNGDGLLATVSMLPGTCIPVDSVRNLMEGMIVEIYNKNKELVNVGKDIRVTAVDRENKTFKINDEDLMFELDEGFTVYLKGAKGNELTGLQAIFSNKGTLYGLSTAENEWLNPYVKNAVGTFNELMLQTALDKIEERSGKPVNFIVCSWGVRRALQAMLAENKHIVNTMELAGGFNAMSYNGIPIVADRFCPEGTMYLLNTDDFALHQLCDWQWITGDDGKVLKQVPGKPVYTATLVKYAELICSRPYGQGVITGIMEA